MTTLLLFIIVLGVLVFVHELGHFMVARWHGIKADEFGFGFPPRIGGFVKDATTGRYRFILGNKHVESPNTIYSLNWIPLGGFVKIKGEDRGSAQDADSFSGRSAWVRVKVLGAGVFMNFLLAWVLFAIVLMLGFPQQIDPNERAKYAKTDVQILQVQPNTPASDSGLKAGDVLLRLDDTPVSTLDTVTAYIGSHRGSEIDIIVRRGEETMTLSGTPRVSTPEGEGALGISFSETAVVSYPWHQAIRLGFEQTFIKTKEILVALGQMLASLVTGVKSNIDIAGPVGIVYLTKEMSDLGMAYLLYFSAILSINLAIINILPIPALDGGRILFVLIEKLKGSPVSSRVEGYVHQTGFVLLILLMLLVTMKDIVRLDFWQRF